MRIALYFLLSVALVALVMHASLTYPHIFNGAQVLSVYVDNPPPPPPPAPSFGGGGGGGEVLVTVATQCGKKGDLNHDMKVDIKDFSIMAYWYKRPLTAAALAQCVDLNKDGKVSLADFSILAYYWGI